MGQVWYCLINGQVLGPFGSSQLRSLVAQKKLLPRHYVRQSPTANWTVAEHVKGLFRSETGDVQSTTMLPAERRWRVRINGRELGPFTDRQLKKYATRGDLKPEHTLRIVGQPEWQEARKIQGLFDSKTKDATAAATTEKQWETVSVKFTCPSCGCALRCGESLVGKSFPCPACTKSVAVPRRQASPAPYVSPPESTRTLAPSAAHEDPVEIRSKSVGGKITEQLQGLSIRGFLGSLNLTGGSSASSDHRPSKDSISFIGPGNVVDLGRGPIEGPLVYASGQRFARVFDASLIELPLPTSRSAHSADPLPYWPTYHECSPQQRTQYLDWIYSGRNDPSVELGYVFIFFYGLERRILVDGEDHAIVIEELLRLMSIHTRSNSFKNYAAALLWLTVFLTADRGGVPENKLSRIIGATTRWRDDSLRYCLGYFGRQKLPLPFEAAAVLAERDERSINSVVTKSHPEKFRSLFVRRFQESHPGGFPLPAKYRERKIEYRPASGTLLAAGNPLPKIASQTIPVFDLSQRHFTSLASDWNECVEELRDFDRVSRRSDSAKMTGEIYESLPPELRAGDHPELSAWQKEISDGVDDGGWPVLRISQLAEIKKHSVRTQLTKKQCEGLLATADILGIAIEPDSRLTGKNYRWDDLVVVFHDKGPVPDEKSLIDYRTAALLLQLGLAIAQADDELDEVELGNIKAHLEREFDLGPRLSKRLDGLKHLLVVNANAEASVAQAVRKALPLEHRRLIGRFLITVAAADKLICEKERKSLKKVFRGLGIPAEELSTLLAQYDVSEAVAAAPALATDVEVESDVAPALNLDRIRAIHEETRRVQELLQSVLANAEDIGDDDDLPEDAVGALRDESESLAIATIEHVYAPPVHSVTATDVANRLSPDGNSRLRGVPERYRAFCRLIVAQQRWRREEASELARQQGLMLSAACEALNDWSTEEIGDWLIEELDAEIIVHTDLLESN